MEKIKIGFSKPKTWKPFSAIIMAGYGIPYDHVYVRIPAPKYDRDLIYQASKTMVNFMGVEVFEADNEILKEFEIEISDDQKKILMQFAIDNAGKPYGWKEAIGLAIVRLAELFGKKIKNPYSGGSSTYVCSVLASYVIENFTNDKDSTPPEDMSPKDVWDFLQKNQ
jgi:hypothetical protein